MIQYLALIGLGLSLYALYVRRRLADTTYHPLCDLHERISCSKAFGSEYGKIIFVPNMVYGIGYYLLVLFFAYFGKLEWILFLSIPAAIASLYLAYVSYIKQNNFCLVCTLIYLVNFALVLVAV